MIKVGLIGTGFVARRRAEALEADGRGQLVAVAGHQWPDTQAFAQTYQATPLDSWQALVAHPEVDLVMVCHLNRDHGVAAAAALMAHKHVVVEYPLALDVPEAASLLALAQANQRLLHVEHIELLGGTHQALKAHLPSLGKPLYARYCTLSPKHPAPNTWTYRPDLFGFPLMGALSRLHRLIDAFGPVDRVYGQNHYDGLQTEADGLARYTTCLCTAQITFCSGVMAEVMYGKGEAIWSETRRLEVWGQTGQLILDGNQGTVINTTGSQMVPVGSRRGLFAADTGQVLDHLLQGTSLYCTPEASLYSLRVAAAVEQSALTGRSIAVESAPVNPHQG